MNNSESDRTANIDPWHLITPRETAIWKRWDEDRAKTGKRPERIVATFEEVQEFLEACDNRSCPGAWWTYQPPPDAPIRLRGATMVKPDGEPYKRCEFLTKAGFAELAEEGLIRCRDCEHWALSRCDNPKLNADIGEVSPDFGCIHFMPRQPKETQLAVAE